MAESKLDPASGAATDGMDVDDGDATRVLACFCDVNDGDPGYEQPGAQSSVESLVGKPGFKVEIMKSPTLDELAAKAEALKPHFIYLCGPYVRPPDSLRGTLGPVTFGGVEVSPGELVSALEDAAPQAVYLDAAAQEKVAELLRLRRVGSVVFWSEDPQALPASHFAGAFFAALAVPGASVLDAYAVALYGTQAHCGKREGDAKLIMPPMPDLMAASADGGVAAAAAGAAAASTAANGGDACGNAAAAAAAHTAPLPNPADDEGAELALPDASSVPPLPPTLDDGLDVSRGPETAVPGWADVRLLAPRAEVRLALCGGAGTIDACRLAYLGEALRALLVLEARRATLLSVEPATMPGGAPAPPPEHLPAGASALLRCELATPSGGRVRALLAAPDGVASRRQLVEHALRQTLAADAGCLQFRLPPAGAPAPVPRTCGGGDAFSGVPAVDALAATSLWAAGVLTQLALDSHYALLAALGVAGVGSAPTAGASPPCVTRFQVIVGGGGGSRPDNGGGGGNGARGGSAGPAPTGNPLAVAADPPIAPHGCGRAPLAEIGEEAFIADLVAFLSHRRGRYIDRAKFPDAVLNGRPLDVYALYREVVSRGGFRVGNGINWKGQVFAAMSNWTQNHKQTGVGAALKRHYAALLWEYEQAHPGDALADRCTICGAGEDTGLSDWIACDDCSNWVHFSCDRRPGLGAFESYAAAGRAYTCPGCAEAEAVKDEEEAAEEEVAGAGAPAEEGGGDVKQEETAAAAAQQQQQPEAGGGGGGAAEPMEG